MSSVKKIGLFACTGVVAGNMMGSGIALLPALPFIIAAAVSVDATI
ncbi:hypothetical protein, partial [Salmonella enterica]